MDEDAIQYRGSEEFDPDVKHMCRLVDFRDRTAVVRNIGENAIAFSFKDLSEVQFEHRMRSRGLVIALRGDAVIVGDDKKGHLLGQGETLFVSADETLEVTPLGSFKMLLLILGPE